MSNVAFGSISERRNKLDSCFDNHGDQASLEIDPPSRGGRQRKTELFSGAKGPFRLVVPQYAILRGSTKLTSLERCAILLLSQVTGAVVGRGRSN